MERQRLNDVLNMLPVYVILLSPDYHVPFANRFFEDRFGKANGQRCYEYLFHRSEPCENCETFKVLKTGAPHRWEWTGPDGCNYDIYDFPFADADGSPLIMEMGINVTEIKRAQAATQGGQRNAGAARGRADGQAARERSQFSAAQHGLKRGQSHSRKLAARGKRAGTGRGLPEGGRGGHAKPVRVHRRDRPGRLPARHRHERSGAGPPARCKIRPGSAAAG